MPITANHTARVAKLGRTTAGVFLARAECSCGWAGRKWSARQTAMAVRCAQVDVNAHKAATCCSCTNYAGDNGPCTTAH
jgi:hypothetical protein